jgi:endonuclease/exonuclease/phosphatase family metal-dependent hydrolase
VRVATWNIRHGRPRRGFTSNRRLVDAVRHLDVDVLAVQEVERRVIRSWFADQPELIARATRVPDHAYAPARRLAVIGSDGVALFVRGEIVRHEVIDLPRSAGLSRVALQADVRVDGHGFTVVTTHLQNEQRAARRELDALLLRLATAARPCVLLGDLNLRPADIDGPLRAAGFVLAGGEPTEPAWAPVQRIDHVAVAGFTIGEVSVLEVDVSDHRPLLAHLSFG